jgi:hypothetical protein
MAWRGVTAVASACRAPRRATLISLNPCGILEVGTMNRALVWVVLLVAAASFPLRSAAAVAVGWTDPARFTDAEDWNTAAGDVVRSLARQLEAVAQRELGPGADVRITLLDVDRAGTVRFNLPNMIRVMHGGADFPCIELEYALTVNGHSASGRERVCDRNYLRRADFDWSPNDPLVYEKRMLTEWLRKRAVQLRGM